MPDTYMAGWDTQRADRLIYTKKSRAAHQQVFEDMKARGYRPLVVACAEPLLPFLSTNFCSIWEKSDGRAWTTQHGISDVNYQSNFDQLKAANWRPVSVTACGSSTTRFSSVWERNDGRGWAAAHGVKAQDYQREFDQQTASGKRLISVCPYRNGNELLYTTVWDTSAGIAWQARHNLSLNDFNLAADQYSAEGYILISGGSTRVGGRDWYAGVWEKRPNISGQVRQAFDQESLGEYAEEMQGLGLTMRTIAVSSLSAETDALLNITPQGQTRSNWCWVTCASMISNYYGVNKTPCQLINLDFDTNRCCGEDPITYLVNCNNGGDLGRVLEKLGMHKSSTQTIATFDSLAKELRAGRPVGMHLSNASVQHYWIITGCQIGNWVRMADPATGTEFWRQFGQMTANTSWTWVGTVYTQRPAS